MPIGRFVTIMCWRPGLGTDLGQVSPAPPWAGKVSNWQIRQLTYDRDGCMDGRTAEQLGGTLLQDI